MRNLATAFRRAIASCRAGQPVEAKRAYNAILAALHDYFDALHASRLIASPRDAARRRKRCWSARSKAIRTRTLVEKFYMCLGVSMRRS